MTTASGKSYLKMTNDDGPFQPNPKSLDGVPDLCMLTYLGELNVLHNLKCRYEKKEIYTSTTAKVLVALNPYEAMPANYTEEVMKSYQEQSTNLEGLADKNSLPPHLFWVANSAYANLVGLNKNQSIIVCGESGSGKTESAKYMMRFLAFTTTSTSVDPSEFAEAEAIGQQVLDANPILESYGNAKTLINNNSSRFGKFTKMLFQEGKIKGKKKLVGAGIEMYLLEKSRVVYQDQGERNYHIFYQLTHCHSQHPELKLKSPEQHKFTGSSNCTTLEDLRYPGKSADENWHKELEEAYGVLKIPDEEKLEAYSVVAGIIHLGDVIFKDKSGEGSDITNPEAVEKAAEMLGVDKAALQRRLDMRTMLLPGGKLLEKVLNQGDAEFNRDSMCRNLYNGLFRWIVHRINKVSFPGDSGAGTTYIGILDIFGFEIFKDNSFEQFCINFANERLQQYFNEHVLMAEQLLYQREALLWNPIDLPNNQDCIDLFTRKPYGIYAILDSTCIQPKGDAKVFTSNLFKQFKYHPKLRKTERREAAGSKQKEAINGFTIKHYAGAVLYNAQEFLVKNSDSSEFDTIELMFKSSKKVAKEVLRMKPDGSMDTKTPERGHKRAFLSTGSVFSDQLVSLMTELKKTAPYFVRCVKPNPQKKPRHFVGDFVRPQLRCGGLIEALRIIKLGFPTRCKYERVYEIFSGILKKKPVTNLNKRDFTEAMCAVVGNKALKPTRDEYQMGLTMIFFRPGKQQFLTDVLEKDPSSITDDQVAKIREFLVKKRWVRAAGLAKGWIRTNNYLSTTRFTKAAVAMNIYYRVFGRALRQARSNLGGKAEEEEARRRAQELEFQMALKAKKDLEEMKKKEAENARLLEEEKARIAQQVADKEAELAAQQEKHKSTQQKYMEMKNAKLEATKKYVDVMKKANEDREAAAAEKRELTDKLTRAESDLQEANGRAATAESEANQLRGEIEAAKAAAGAGKEEYERQIREKDTRIEDLERQLRLAEEGRANDKKDFESQLSDKDKRIADLEGRIKEAEAETEKVRASSKEEGDKLREEAENARKELREAKGDLETKLKVMEKETENRKAELETLKNETIKKKDDELDKMREEVKSARASANKAKSDAAREISEARAANTKANEKLAEDLQNKSQSLSVLRADVREIERERDMLKEKLEKKIEQVKEEVAKEHRREHQAQMNELQEKLDREIRDLKDEVRSLENQLEVARKWRTNKGKR